MSEYGSIDLGEQGWEVLYFPELVKNPGDVKSKVLEIAASLGHITVHGDYPGAMPIRPSAEAPESFYATSGALKFHTDVAWWPYTPPYGIVMGCERPAADGGGVSRHVNAWKTFQALPDKMRTLLIERPVLIPAAPHHIRSADMVDFGDRQGVIRPSVSFSDSGRPILRLIPDKVFFKLNRDQPDVLDAISAWSEANEKAADNILLKIGMVVVSNNLEKVAHARDAFDDENRCLWRSYFNPRV